MSLPVRALTARYPGITTCPIYWISTHGEYDMEKYRTGTPFEIVVPANTLVIETSLVDEACYFAKHLGDTSELFSDRTKLLNYLTGVIDERDSPEMRSRFINALSICTVYKPGDTIVNRILTLESGRGTNRVYTFMKPMVYTVTGRIDDTLGDVYDRLKTDQRAFETYEGIFNHGVLRRLPFKILVFPSCGVVTNPDASTPARVQRIKDIQLNARANWVTQFTATSSTYIAANRRWTYANAGANATPTRRWCGRGVCGSLFGYGKHGGRSRRKHRRARKTRKN